MGYAPQAVIDHAALRHNLQQVHRSAPASRIWSVIKADAYGHGIERVARALLNTDGFAVARIDEALNLRQGGFDHPIMIMGGCYTQEALMLAARNGFEVTVHDIQQLSLFDALSSGSHTLTVWLKVDTGMHRLGFAFDHIDQIIDRLRAHPCVKQLNLMTHLANADDRGDSATQTQLAHFDSLPLHTFSQCSIANSAGVLGFRESHRDWVRPGIMLYGVSPFVDSSADDEGLQPVMTLRSRVIAVRQCQRSDRIGYGGSYECPEAMPVAVVAAGYGDGYPRHAVEGTPVLIEGRRLPLIGRVSMDMITLDARDYPSVKVGDEVVLWGRGLPVEEVAKKAGTIGYELLCGVTSRVSFMDQNVDEDKEI
ncbi:MAG: alanine racemase [Candidatus Thiodiazotropha sp. (ex Myrtea sp. 'scaly one' KF741663)]|nr:alanine racemase [Candidatus Thiodiazotropha sp. (ex Myrtea sp. 'scaly one' KF741663)]